MALLQIAAVGYAILGQLSYIGPADAPDQLMPAESRRSAAALSQAAGTGTGRRKTKGDVLISVSPLDRISSRIETRVRNRLEERIDQRPDASDTSTSAIENAQTRVTRARSSQPKR